MGAGSSQADVVSGSDEGAGMRTAAYVLYGVGGAAAIGGALWYLLDRRHVGAAERSDVIIGAWPGGVSLRARW